MASLFISTTWPINIALAIDVSVSNDLKQKSAYTFKELRN